MDIKYPIKNKYMKCVSQINGFSGLRPRVQSSRRVWGRDIITPPKIRLFPLREKIADNLTSPREMAGEGHVPPVKPGFPRGEPSSPRYRMMSPRDKFTSLKDMVGNKPFFQGRELQR